MQTVYIATQLFELVIFLPHTTLSDGAVMCGRGISVYRPILPLLTVTLQLLLLVSCALAYIRPTQHTLHYKGKAIPLGPLTGPK
jgi:hypothetical protein